MHKNKAIYMDYLSILRFFINVLNLANYTLQTLYILIVVLFIYLIKEKLV